MLFFRSDSCPSPARGISWLQQWPLLRSSTTLLYAARIAKTEAVRLHTGFCISRGSYKPLGLAHGKVAARGLRRHAR